jgi:hypothetical protein
VQNDLGRAPKGTGEKGRDSDDESDGSDGEGGSVDPDVAAAIRSAKKRNKRPTDNEDSTGRPIGLTLVEAERGQRRQRWAVNHTAMDLKAQLLAAGVGGQHGDDEADGVAVLLDPPNTDKLSFKPNELQERAGGEIKGALAKLRHDLNQVLLGREDDLPDYSAVVVNARRQVSVPDAVDQLALAVKGAPKGSKKGAAFRSGEKGSNEGTATPTAPTTASPTVPKDPAQPPPQQKRLGGPATAAAAEEEEEEGALVLTGDRGMHAGMAGLLGNGGDGDGSLGDDELDGHPGDDSDANLLRMNMTALRRGDPEAYAKRRAERRGPRRPTYEEGYMYKSQRSGWDI